MTDLQGLELRASEIRSRLAELGLLTDLDTEQRGEMETLGKEYGNNEARQRALRIAGDGLPDPIETRNDGEGREYRELRRKAGFGAYVAGALSGGGVKDGAELELNRHLGIADNFFPMEMLAGLDDFEKRAARDGDGMASQSTWLDRVMAEAAEYAPWRLNADGCPWSGDVPVHLRRRRTYPARAHRGRNRIDVQHCR